MIPEAVFRFGLILAKVAAARFERRVVLEVGHFVLNVPHPLPFSYVRRRETAPLPRPLSPTYSDHKKPRSVPGCHPLPPWARLAQRGGSLPLLEGEDTIGLGFGASGA